jgi:MoxR-like ATPase
LIDEIDAGDANTLLCLQIILEGKPYYFSALGEYVHPAPGFNVIMTANTKGQGSESGRYFGTNILNEAFMERIALTFEQEFPSAAIEKKIIVNMMNSYGCVDEGFAEELVKWADAIRRSFADGAVDSVISTRRLEHIVRGFSIFEDKKKVVQYAVNRFDTMTKQAFFDLFDKISVDPTTKATSTEATETPVAA